MKTMRSIGAFLRSAWQFVFCFRKVFLAIPVIVTAIVLACRNASVLPGARGLVFVHGRDLFAAGEQAAGCVWPSSGDWPQPHFYGCFQEGVLSLAHFGDHVGSAVFDPASESIWLLVALEVLHERK